MQFMKMHQFCKNIFSSFPIGMDGTINIFSQQQVRRNNWPDWRMLKDYNKRMLVKKHGADRDRLNTIRKCDLLPREIREIADKEIIDIPRYSCYRHVVRRCVVTSRPRGTVKRWHLSRIVFRHLADYNKLSGVQRAIW